LFVACIVALLVMDLVWIVVPQPLIIGIVLGVSGTITGAFNVVFGSIRQRIVPNHLLGRVMGSFRVISWGALPLGALLGGIVGQTFGLTAVFIGAAAIHLCLLPSRLILTDAFMAQVEGRRGRQCGRNPGGAASRRGVGLFVPLPGKCRPRYRWQGLLQNSRLSTFPLVGSTNPIAQFRVTPTSRNRSTSQLGPAGTMLPTWP
jgi:hypothetical protein